MENLVFYIKSNNYSGVAKIKARHAANKKERLIE